MDITDFLPKDNEGGTKSGGGDKQRYRDYVIDANKQEKKPLPFNEWYALQNG